MIFVDPSDLHLASYKPISLATPGLWLIYDDWNQELAYRRWDYCHTRRMTRAYTVCDRSARSVIADIVEDCFGHHYLYLMDRKTKGKR